MNPDLEGGDFHDEIEVLGGAAAPVLHCGRYLQYDFAARFV
jgi:hypothetical protein